MANTCTDCTQPDQPFLIKVVDEDGSFLLCGLCVLQLVTRLGHSGDITVLVAHTAVTA